MGIGLKGKVIEAMYNQIPLITRAEELSLVENAFIVADKDEEFANKVIELYEDFDMLRELSDNLIQFIKNYFTSETAKKIILSLQEEPIDFCRFLEQIYQRNFLYICCNNKFTNEILGL